MRVSQFGEQALRSEPGLNVLAQRKQERTVCHHALAIAGEHEVEPEARGVRAGSAPRNKGDARRDQRVVGRHLDGERRIAIGVTRGIGSDHVVREQAFAGSDALQHRGRGDVQVDVDTTQCLGNIPEHRRCASIFGGEQEGGAGVFDVVGRSFLPDLLLQVVSSDIAETAGPALASMLIYILMILVLFFRPEGLFPASAD